MGESKEENEGRTGDEGMGLPRPCPRPEGKGESEESGGESSDSCWTNPIGPVGGVPPRPRPRPSPPLPEEVEKGIRVCLAALEMFEGFGSFLPIPIPIPIPRVPLILAFDPCNSIQFSCRGFKGFVLLDLSTNKALNFWIIK